MINKTTPLTTQKAQSYHKTTVDIAGPNMRYIDVQPIASTVQGAAESTNLNGYTGARAERCQRIVTKESTDQFMACTQMLRKHRWLKLF